MTMTPPLLSLTHSLKQKLRLGTMAKLEVVGTTSSLAIADLFSQPDLVSERRHLIITKNHASTLQLLSDLKFHAEQVRAIVLPEFDQNAYSTVYPSHQIIGKRLHWLYQVQLAAWNPIFENVFVASVEALMQKTLPQSVFQKLVIDLQVGDTLPEDWRDSVGKLRFINSPLVEDVGQIAVRGGIIDIFSPSDIFPVRIELNGDEIESIRYFDPISQRSLKKIDHTAIVPAAEALYCDENNLLALQRFKASCQSRGLAESDYRGIVESLARQQIFPEMDYFVPYLYIHPSSPLDYLPADTTCWLLDEVGIESQAIETTVALKAEFQVAQSYPICPDFSDLYSEFNVFQIEQRFGFVSLTDLNFYRADNQRQQIQFQSQIPIFSTVESSLEMLRQWRAAGTIVYVVCHHTTQIPRLVKLLNDHGFTTRVIESPERQWQIWERDQQSETSLLHIIYGRISHSIFFKTDKIALVQDVFIRGGKVPSHSRDYTQSPSRQLSAYVGFQDLSVGDSIVHRNHGIGRYLGLTLMNIDDNQTEFLTLEYKNSDKLYLPVTKISLIKRYGSPAAEVSLDQLGSTQWTKVKAKIHRKLREIASELLKLYSKRVHIERPPYYESLSNGGIEDEKNYQEFIQQFPYNETPDQDQAITDVLSDLCRPRPMDRLICGDVGFGKTEVAMRAAFVVAMKGRQVVVLAPTTVLTFQHFQNFKNRFTHWPLKIKVVNRFVDRKELTKTLKEVHSGQIQIIIGTHRLLGKDVLFHDLGLIVIDEEHKFGVAHKERLRQLRYEVDTLAMSATPIPRTLNMGLVGMRDLSLMTTPPGDRLPTRTFVCKSNDETIRKAITSELDRGGQVFFVHNRIQSIYPVAQHIQSLVPQARIQVAHGQMPDDTLEKTILAFFNRQIDILVCTSIIESGTDVANANTMFIDQAHTLGLSQLYQLRGRVGRSQNRAYCYLLIPKDRPLDRASQERLKVIQENTELGSGFSVAQYDLELRGAGNLLGEDQSGHVQSVGYEMYLELLEQVVKEMKNEAASSKELEPEIRVRIPAFIPDFYIRDFKIRLRYYRMLSDITSSDDLARIEDDLRDRFGTPPLEVTQLMGLMLIRYECKRLGIRDLSSAPHSISLYFSENAALDTEKIIQLALSNKKKYTLLPDNKLRIRLTTQEWTDIYDELVALRGP